jgi:hypothetical protein
MHISFSSDVVQDCVICCSQFLVWVIVLAGDHLNPCFSHFLKKVVLMWVCDVLMNA